MTAPAATLSFRAQGLLAFIRAHPDVPVVSDELARHAKEGRKAIQTALLELVEAGVILRDRLQDERGCWRTVTVIAGHTGGRKPTVGNPTVGPSAASSKDPLDLHSSDCGGAQAHPPPPTLLTLRLEDHPFWSNGLSSTLARLRAGGVPDDLLEPRFVAGIRAMTEPTGVYWDDELLKYQVWWADQPASARRRKRRLQFGNWIKRAMASDRATQRREEERRAGTSVRRTYNPR